MAEPREIEITLTRIVLGDRDAFEAMYAMLSPQLFGVCRLLLREQPDAEAALAEIYARIWNEAHAFPAHDIEPKTWILTVARETVVSCLRARREAGRDEQPLKLSGQLVEKHLRMSKAGEVIERAYLFGESYAELSVAFGRSPGSLRAELREGLGELEGVPSGTGAHDKALAGEYALGLLAPESAGAFEDRMAHDERLSSLFSAWCHALVALLDAPEEMPPKQVWATIKKRLFAERSVPETLLRWALGAALGATAAALVALVSARYLIPLMTQVVLQAQLTGPSDLAVQAQYESRTGTLSAVRVGSAPASGFVHELWLAFPNGEVLYLGNLDDSGRLEAVLEAVPPETLATSGLALAQAPVGAPTSLRPSEPLLATGLFSVSE